MSRLPDPPYPVEVPAAASGVRDLETAIALTTHQCAALAAGVQAAVSQAVTRAVADLNAAVADAEQRIEQAAARAVARIEQATGP